MGEEDLVIAVSDGVLDNLDPQSLGYPPSDFGFDKDSWRKLKFESEIVLDKVRKKKQNFMMNLLIQVICGIYENRAFSIDNFDKRKSDDIDFSHLTPSVIVQRFTLY